MVNLKGFTATITGQASIDQLIYQVQTFMNSISGSWVVWVQSTDSHGATRLTAIVQWDT